MRRSVTQSRSRSAGGWLHSPRPGALTGLGLSAGVVAVAVALLSSVASARAADRIYWANYTGNTISYAKLDGTGSGGDVNTSGGDVSFPTGVTIDAAAGRIYWDNFGGTAQLAFARLDGFGGGNLFSTSVATNGVALDKAAGHFYVVNPNGGGQILRFNLDGSGPLGLSNAGATMNGPEGLTIDVASGRVFWANRAGNKISYTRLDGTGGGGDLNTTGATVSGPSGVALDPASGRIYWANYTGNKISSAKLDGTGGGGDLNTTGATVSGPSGVALDPASGRIYWANYTGNKISFAKLDGTGGGGDLNTAGATVNTPRSPALLSAPTANGAAAVTGTSTPGSVLSCSDGGWAPDLVGTFLSRAPQTVTHAWSLGGTDIAGATSDTYTAFAPGDYRCTITASNAAGAAAQQSAPHAIAAPVPPPDTVAPTIAPSTVRPARWRLGSRLPRIARRTSAAPVGTTITVGLDEPAKVTLTFDVVTVGRRAGNRCAARTRANRRRALCIRYAPGGSLTRHLGVGIHHIAFQGRINARTRLRLGRYRLRLDAIDATGNRARTRTAAFTIVSR